MIVRQEPDRLVLVRQADHALLSGSLAAAWGNPPWSAPEPYESAVIAARLHDLAWTPFDEALPCRPDGRPYAFHEVSRGVTTRLYSRGVDAVEAIDGYAGLLSSLHLSGFFTSHWGWHHPARPATLPRDERDAVEGFVQGELLRQRRLRERLGIDGPRDRQLMCGYLSLQLWDRISLDICRHGFAGWAAEYPPVPVTADPRAEPVRLRVELHAGGVCRLDPYPLCSHPYRAALIAVHLPLGLLEDRAELRRAWRAGGTDATEITFVSGERPG